MVSGCDSSVRGVRSHRAPTPAVQRGGGVTLGTPERPAGHGRTFYQKSVQRFDETGAYLIGVAGCSPGGGARAILRRTVLSSAMIISGREPAGSEHAKSGTGLVNWWDYVGEITREHA